MEETIPKQKGKIKKLKEKLFFEGGKLGIKEDYNQQELKTELERINGNKVEDWEVLQAIWKGRDLQDDKISIQNLFDKQCQELDQMIDKLRGQEDPQELEKKFRTAQQNVSKIENMDEFQFSQYQSQQNPEKSKQQTRLDRLISKQLEGLNKEVDQQSQKDIKKRLTQQIFDQYKTIPIHEEPKNENHKDEILDEESQDGTEQVDSVHHSSQPSKHIEDVDQIESDAEHSHIEESHKVPTKENSEDLNNEGTELVESDHEENNILNTEMDVNSSMEKDIKERREHQSKIERESLIREDILPNEGTGRQSYKLDKLINSQKKIKQQIMNFIIQLVEFMGL